MSHDDDNTELGKYRIVGQVGEGAMGVVYRAIDPVLNRTVAIKVMSDGIARDDDLRTRFLREAQAAGSLQHPNVITIYDCGEVDGHLFIAMEFVEGHDLETLLDSHASMSLVAKIDIIIDVLGGLAYAHKRGIVHRDIKPANIRIDEEGRARIMDFGIAHLQSSNMTKTGVIVGTPAYMAPEQITGQSVSPATDIFSVGAVLYELLSGVRPFHADTLQGVMYKIVSESPSDLSKLSTGLPLAINSVVQKALAKDPKDRYTSALDMANDLTKIRSSLDRTTIMKSVSLRSVIDTQLSGSEKQAKSKESQRRWYIVSGIAAVGILAIAASALLRNRPHAAVPAPTDTPAQTAAKSPAEPASQAPTTLPPSPTPPSTTPTATASVPASKPTPEKVAETKTTQGKPDTKSAPKQNAATKTAQSPAATPGSTAVGPSAQEMDLFRSLRISAMDVRKRASDAGATTDQLRAGDDHVNAADASIASGKMNEAAGHLTQATTAWTNAERDARAATAAAASARRVATEPVKQQAVAPAPSPAATIAPAVATPPQPAPSPSAEISSAVAAYARAIESRDVAEVRRAYPGITNAQASGFEQFFGTVRSLKATLSVSELDVNGSSAEARLTGEYDYVTSGGKNEKQPLNFRASFRRDGGAWKLISVR